MIAGPGLSREQFAMHLLHTLATVGASLDSLVPNLTTFQQHMTLCVTGNPHSMFIVGLCCLCERFGMHDATQGVEYLANSASRGHSWAAWILSLCYRAGVGVPQNAALAQLYETMATDATTIRSHSAHIGPPALMAPT
jgi:TPR repeat protein